MPFCCIYWPSLISKNHTSLQSVLYLKRNLLVLSWATVEHGVGATLGNDAQESHEWHVKELHVASELWPFLHSQLPSWNPFIHPLKLNFIFFCPPFALCSFLSSLFIVYSVYALRIYYQLLCQAPCWAAFSLKLISIIYLFWTSSSDLLVLLKRAASKSLVFLLWRCFSSCIYNQNLHFLMNQSGRITSDLWGWPSMFF